MAVVLPPLGSIMSYYANVQYLTGAWQATQFPPDHGVEVAFAGRSNSGKSSAINAITGRIALARTSKTPGRTQLINFFTMQPQQRLVDLPGYGFAKVPPAMQQHWHELMSSYFEQRQSLTGLVVLMDSRHPLKDTDLQMLEWGQSRQLRCHILLSKADKLTQSEGMKIIREVRASVGEGVTVQLFSATTNRGVDEARRFLDGCLKGK
ncbi:MAG: ribosome biogenesis GTP-binding protein YihA/YsxC [Steroidobacteraceae bacterium]